MTFGWSANGAPVSEWWLTWARPSAPATDADTGSRLGAELSRTVTGLPEERERGFRAAAVQDRRQLADTR